MTLLQLSPLPRYHTATYRGGAYGQQLNEKATSRVAHSKIINASRRPTAGNIAGVVTVMVAAAFMLPQYSLSQVFGDCKYLGDVGHFYYL